MAYYRIYQKHWKPSKEQKQQFADKMREIDAFLESHDISASANRDSYYFSINGINYRVSNHSIEASNRKAFNAFGEQIRDKYHADSRDKNTVYIHAGKTRIIQIYNDLLEGKTLDGRGNPVEC